MSTPASTARLASSELPTVSITVAPARMRFLNVRATGERPAQKYETIRTSSSRQMAAALLDHHAAGRVLVRSAGTVPAGEINPAVVVVMGELCIDLSKEFPKPLTTRGRRRLRRGGDHGCGATCPVFPGKRYLDWELPDPSGKLK